MSVTRWWFQTCLLIFTPSCGKIPISRSIFQMGGSNTRSRCWQGQSNKEAMMSCWKLQGNVMKTSLVV